MLKMVNRSANSVKRRAYSTRCCVYFSDERRNFLSKWFKLLLFWQRVMYGMPVVGSHICLNAW